MREFHGLSRDAGTSVTVHVGVEERRRAGPYFVSLLRDLGFDARLHVFPAGLDAAIGRARAAAPEDAPAAWAAVDRRIVEIAATVPYVNSRLTVFVSKRVGNVTSHPMYFTLLDQMWVR